MSGTSRASDSPWARSSRNVRVAAGAVAGDERVAERPDLALGAVGGDRLDVVEAELGAAAVLERELLELAQQALLAVADGGDERLGGGVVDLDAEALRLAAGPSAAARAP